MVGRAGWILEQLITIGDWSVMVGMRYKDTISDFCDAIASQNQRLQIAEQLL